MSDESYALLAMDRSCSLGTACVSSADTQRYQQFILRRRRSFLSEYEQGSRGVEFTGCKVLEAVEAADDENLVSGESNGAVAIATGLEFGFWGPGVGGRVVEFDRIPATVSTKHATGYKYLAVV